MTKGFYIAILAVYTLCLALITIYALFQLHLAWKYHRKKGKQGQDPQSGMDELPLVTVQLPVFNERYVVERLIEAVGSLDYPKDKLEIQVLDDSTDDSFEIAGAKIAELKSQGLNIKHIKRPDREGFKAGALQYGMEIAEGEFIAIFDADFIPEPSFIMKLLPEFRDPQIGMVQARWGHINEDYSLLTRVQAFHLNHHFTTEQQGRNLGGYFMNFNGTGGMWRKSTIEDAGGWEANTLTEDLDLSYRAQLKGWKFKFIEHAEAPAELPAVMSAIRSQQYRWMKGSSEVARKHLLHILRSKEVPLGIKIHSFGHLLGSSIFILILLLAVLTLPLICFRHLNSGLFPDWYITVNNFLRFSFVGFVLAHLGTTALKPGGIWKKAGYFAFTFPSFICLSTGMAYHNGKAVMQGFLGVKSDFIRTPKFNIMGLKDQWLGNIYISRRLDGDTMVEGLLWLYFLASTILAVIWGFYDILPFLLLVTTGFGLIVFFSVKHHRIAQKNSEK